MGLCTQNTQMDDIPYSRIRVIYLHVLRPCVVGFALRNVREENGRWWCSIFPLPTIISKRRYEAIQ